MDIDEWEYYYASDPKTIAYKLRQSKWAVQQCKYQLEQLNYNFWKDSEGIKQLVSGLSNLTFPNLNANPVDNLIQGIDITLSALDQRNFKVNDPTKNANSLEVSVQSVASDILQLGDGLIAEIKSALVTKGNKWSTAYEKGVNDFLSVYRPFLVAAIAYCKLKIKDLS